jgi:uncharacterized Zn-binding protein involved in type VI secretion
VCAVCAPNVLIGGLPAARISDLLICIGPPDVIVTGADTVLIGGLPAARMGDMTAHGGVIVIGCMTVLIGDGGDSDGDDDDDDDEDDEDEENSDDSDDSDGDSDDDSADPSDASSDAEGGGGGDGGEGGGAGGGGDGSSEGLSSSSEGQLASPAGDPADADAAATNADGVNTYSGPIDKSPTTLSAEVFSTTDEAPLADAPSMGDQIGSGLWQGATDGALEAAKGAVSAAQGVFNLATSQAARDDAVSQVQSLAGNVAQGVANPGETSKLFGQAVSNAVNNFNAARQQAIADGREAEFNAKIAGRAAFELGMMAVPAAGAARKLSAAIELSQAAKAAGITRQAAVSLQRIAAKYDVIVEMRPTNPAARRLIELGHSPKPEFLKMKTITEVDQLIGAPKTGGIGEVGFFKPTMPDAALQQTNPALYAKAVARYDLRAAEQERYAGRIKQLQNAKIVKVEDGVVKNAANGKSFTGDNDVFQVRGANGRTLTPQEHSAVMNELQNGPVKAQHGAHMDWQTKNAVEEKMKQDIIREHMSPGQGGGGVQLHGFGPSGYSTTWATP